MTVIQNALVFMLYLFAGTHAVPKMRLSLLGFSTPYSILIFYTIIFVAFLKIIGERGKVKFPPTLLTAFAIYYFSIVLSSNFAKDIDGELLFKWFLFPLMPICISLIGNKLNTIKYALVLFMVSGFCVFLYGIYGFVTWKVGDPLQHTLGYFGVTYEASSRNGDMLYFQSTFWILAAISLYADRVSRILRILCGFLAAMVAGGLVLSLARGAWISAVLTFIAVIFIQKSLRKSYGIFQVKYFKTKLTVILLFITALLSVFLFTAGDDYKQLLAARTDSISTLSEEGGNSNLARTRLLLKAAEVAVKHPFGVGPWNLKYYLEDFYMTGLASAENVYFQVVAEEGIVGLVAYLYILLWTYKRLYRHLSIIKQSSDQWVGWSLICILINWSAYGLFNIMIETLWYWLGISLAVALGTTVTTIRREEKSDCKTYQTG